MAKIKSQMLQRIHKRCLKLRLYLEDGVQPLRGQHTRAAPTNDEVAARERKRHEIEAAEVAARRSAAAIKPAGERPSDAQVDAAALAALQKMLPDEDRTAPVADRRVRAIAACLLRCLQRHRASEVLIRALPATDAATIRGIVQALDGSAFEDSGAAHEFVSSALRPDEVAALAAAADALPQPRAYLPPKWSRFDPNERRLTPGDIPNAVLRAYIEGNPTLKSAWFRVTGDRSTNEYRFAWLLHKDQKVNLDEAAELCCLLPGGKSVSDPRGREYAESNVLENVASQGGEFGPGIGAFDDDVEDESRARQDGSPDGEARRPRRQLTEEEKAARKAEKQARQRILGPKTGRKIPWRQKHLPDHPPTIMTLAHMGDAPLRRTAAALQGEDGARIETSPWRPTRQRGQVLKRAWKQKKRASLMALACWLLEEGVPRAGVEATLAGSACTPELAKLVVGLVLEAATRRIACPNEGWIRAAMPESYARLKAAIEADLKERNDDDDRRARGESLRSRAQPPADETDAERRDREENDRFAQRSDGIRSLAQARHQLSGHGHGHEHDGHGAPGGDPDEPARDPRARAGRVARSPREYLWRLARRLNQTFFPIGPSAAVPGLRLGRFVLAYLVLGGVPNELAMATCDEAGIVNARHAADLNREVARLNIHQVRNLIQNEPTLGKRWLKAAMDSLEIDLRYIGRPEGLEPAALAPDAEDGDPDRIRAALVQRIREEIVDGGQLTTRERMFMDTVSREAGRNGSALADGANCGIYANYFRCDNEAHGPNGHDAGRILISTNRETTCRHCRARWADAYRSYIEKKWPERMFCVRIPASEFELPAGDPQYEDLNQADREVMTEFGSVQTSALRARASRWGAPRMARSEKNGLPTWVAEIDANNRRSLPAALARRWAYGDDYALLFMPVRAATSYANYRKAKAAGAATPKDGACAAGAPSTEAADATPRGPAEEPRDDFISLGKVNLVMPGVASEDAEQAAPAQEPARASAQGGPAEPEDDGLHPSDLGSESDYRGRVAYREAINAFRRATGTGLPILKFERDPAKGDLPDEDDPNVDALLRVRFRREIAERRVRYRDLAELDGIVNRECQEAYTISRAQAAELMVEALHSIGRRFDRLLRAESPFLGQYDWLNPNQKRTTSNKLGKVIFPWKREEVQEEIGQLAIDALELTEEQRAVPEGHCNQYIPDPNRPGEKMICGRPYLVSLVHEESGTVLAQNHAGMRYNRRDAEERMQAGGHRKFAHTGPGDLEPGGLPTPLREAG